MTRDYFFSFSHGERTNLGCLLTPAWWMANWAVLVNYALIDLSPALWLPWQPYNDALVAVMMCAELDSANRRLMWLNWSLLRALCHGALRVPIVLVADTCGKPFPLWRQRMPLIPSAWLHQPCRSVSKLHLVLGGQQLCLSSGVWWALIS